MAQKGPITGPAVRNTPPDADDWGLVTRPILGGLPPIVVIIPQPTTSTVTTVGVGAATVLILASNASRLGALIWNDSNARLYVKLGLGASTANFTVRLDGQAYFELPFPVYTGDITAVRAAGPVSSVQVTELT